MLRTSNYIPGPHDVVVPGSCAEEFGLRNGDTLEGAVRDGGKDQSGHNTLARLDKHNGLDPEKGSYRPEFDRLTAVIPSRRLQLETDQDVLATRAIDLIAPLAKGHRVLVVTPAGRGKRTLIGQMADGFSKNNMECHLMLLALIDDPAAITDYRRTVTGEVIDSGTPPSAANRVEVALFALERAKRLVEMGHDVIFVIESMTDLCKAYSDTAHGRRAADADPPWIDNPRRLFLQARAIESGGSLTIVAAIDEIRDGRDGRLYRVLADTCQAEIRLDSSLATAGSPIAIDVLKSRTFDEGFTLSPEELTIRRTLDTLEPTDAASLLNEQLQKTSGNEEFLRQVQRPALGRRFSSVGFDNRRSGTTAHAPL
jgi:transcription termination factor Rho